MVAVDDERKPVAVPLLRPISIEHKRRHATAVVRKELCQEFGECFEKLRKLPANPDVGAHAKPWSRGEIPHCNCRRHGHFPVERKASPFPTHGDNFIACSETEVCERPDLIVCSIRQSQLVVHQPVIEIGMSHC